MSCGSAGTATQSPVPPDLSDFFSGVMRRPSTRASTTPSADASGAIQVRPGSELTTKPSR